MKNRLGYLEVISGPMFSGKTEELIRQVKRAIIGKRKIQVFKHAIDTRYGHDHKLHSHAGISFDSEIISNSQEIMHKLHQKTEIVVIDEAQWFGESLIPVVSGLLDRGCHVIVAGLALTFDREPFTPIPTLTAMADRVTKLSAICSICGDDAVFHKRITKTRHIDAHVADPAFVGKLESYQARCRNCFNKK